MKTNQIMIRSNPAFVQRTSDGYLNATVLLDNWNSKPGVQVKQMARYKENQSTIDFVELLKGEGIKSPFLSTRGKYGGTWMHPKLYVDFAMWVSIEFKSDVLGCIVDGLIKSRTDAGDYYNQMSAAILESFTRFFKRKPNPTIYINEARRIKALLGVNGQDRNCMTEKQLQNITRMQKFNAHLLGLNLGKDARVKKLEYLAMVLQL